MGSRRILIAEDNALIGELLELRFQGAGFATRLCRDGQEAAEALRTWRSDLLVADIQLPGLDGLELLRRLRGDPATAGLPVIIITAYRYGGEVEQARALGAQAVLSKPFEFAELLRRAEALTASTRPEARGHRDEA